MIWHPIEFDGMEGHIDFLEVDSCGVIRIHGWYHRFEVDQSTCPELQVNGETASCTKVFRIDREDVNRALNTERGFRGVIFEYVLPEHLVTTGARTLKAYWKSKCILSVRDSTKMELPAYPYLLNDERAFHRDWIYCSGLPVDYLNPEVLNLAKTLPGPILDLGCGTGVLADAIRSSGKECLGLELDVAEIRDSIPADRKEYIKFYSGTMPLPYGDGEFESVILSEVLEHLPEPDAVIADVARICNDSLLISVPDLSAVPLNHKNEVVPWHLLESTHLNFFNATSLESFLKQWFPKVDLYRIGRTVTNDTQWWSGLMALARKGG